jgi:hypothetical protein
MLKKSQLLPTPNVSDSHNANMKGNHDGKKSYLRGIVHLLPTPQEDDASNVKCGEKRRMTLAKWIRTDQQEAPIELNQLPLLPVDSLASLSVLPGSDQAKQMTATSGQKCCVLLRKSDPPGCLVKMLLESSEWNSTLCYLTWKESATPRRHLLFQLVPSMPRTEGIESGLWLTPHGEEKNPGPQGGHLTSQVKRMFLTPNALDSLDVRDSEALLKNREKNRPGRTTHSTLREQIACPPPSQMWPTPKERDWKGQTQRGIHAEQDSLANMNNGEGKPIGGQLNPNWVEWLMGFPIGWTDLNALETP